MFNYLKNIYLNFSSYNSNNSNNRNSISNNGNNSNNSNNSNSNNNSISNNSNNNNKIDIDSNNLDDLFFAVFRNVYLRKEIEKHLREFEDIPFFFKRDLHHHPKRGYLRKIHLRFNETINQGDIPFGVEELVFYARYDKEIKPFALPSSIKSIKFDQGSRYRHKFTEGALPIELESLTLPNDYAEIIDSYPSTLKSLHIGDSYDPLLPGAIPSSVTTLYLSENFDQPLKQGDLPSNLTSLSFGEFYDRTLSIGSIPASCTSVTFGVWFNNGGKPLATGVIPNGVKSITFKDNFTQPLLFGSIPHSCTSLKLGKWFDKQLTDDSIPNSIINLQLDENYDKSLPNNLNKSIKITGSYKLNN